MARLRSVLLGLALGLVFATSARAQDPDIIRGRVTGPDSLPLENATVTVSTIPGDIVKTARTDKNGRGHVTGPDGLPLENATVTVSTIPRDIVKTTRTGRSGSFTGSFTVPRSDYWVLVLSIGYAQSRFEVKRLADEDVLVADVRMSRT